MNITRQLRQLRPQQTFLVFWKSREELLAGETLGSRTLRSRKSAKRIGHHALPDIGPKNEGGYGDFIKKMEERFLHERARIGFLGNYDVFICTDDSGVPHFHIWDSESKGAKYHTCIKIGCAEYYRHTGTEASLSQTEKENLCAFLKREHNPFPTNWEYLICMWNDNNDSIHVDENAEMPDYMQLN